MEDFIYLAVLILIYTMIDMHTNLFLPQQVFNRDILSLKTMYSLRYANKKTAML